MFESGTDRFVSQDLTVNAELTPPSFLLTFAGTISDSHPIFSA